jgi:ribosome-binding factor A
MARSRPSAGGPGQRQLRVAEVIRRALSDILARGELRDPELEQVSITVGEVRASPDLRRATVFVVPLGGANTEGVTRALNRNRAEIRRLVTPRINLKFSPELAFEPDRTFDQMERTRRLLASDAVRRDVDKD